MPKIRLLRILLTIAGPMAFASWGPQLLSAKPCFQELKQQEIKKTQQDETLKEIVQKGVKSKFVPGMVAGIARKGEPIRMAAAGTLKLKSDKLIRIDHKVHLGSCTKAMTAVLVARLVDQGKATWNTTVIQAAPHLKEVIDPSYHSITFLELLRHQSGLPANAKNWFLDAKKAPREARLIILKSNLKKPIKDGAKGRFVYSNLGYMLAGYMAATIEKTDWETLIRREVFKPLKIESAGFGPPSVNGNLDGPWGHKTSFLGVTTATQHDNAPALGPAGTVHMKLEDWSKFGLALAIKENAIKKQLANPAKANPAFAFLSAKSLKKIHSLGTDPVSKKTQYGLGWIVLKRKWTSGNILFHNGSNTYWYAEIWVVPERECCYMAVTNSAGTFSTAAVQKTITQLVVSDLENFPNRKNDKSSGEKK